MLILLLPVTTIVVALVGFYVWHLQLVRKRQFEVADAALSAFRRAKSLPQRMVSLARRPQAPRKQEMPRLTSDELITV